jgi:hypothetical protein
MFGGSLQKTYVHSGEFKEEMRRKKIPDDDNFSQKLSARLNLVQFTLPRGGKIRIA